MTAPDLPLSGIRVLDFCWVLAGPLGTRILANFGADVIRVESLARPDNFRVRPAPSGTNSLDLGYWFNDVNVGKRSITVDLSTSRGRELILALIAQADVVANNYRPGVLDRLGLGFEVGREVNPNIVYANLPGCGPTGPWANRATMGGMLTAAAGYNTLMGFPDQPPLGMGCAYPDFTSPYLLASTVLTAVGDARAGAGGREVTLSQISSAVSFLGVEVLQQGQSSGPSVARRNRHPDYCPHGVFPAAGTDEWVAIAVETDQGWRALCEAMERPALCDDPRFSSHQGRKAHEDEIETVVSEWTRRHSRWDVAGQLQAAGVAAAPVQDVRDMLERDPQLSKHYQTVRQPAKPEIDLIVDGDPIRFRGLEVRLRRAPQLGEHNYEVLTELLGLADDEIAELLVDGTIN